eukprot:4785468-Amphidinium_carterae.1
MAMFGASPIANTDSLDSPPPQCTGAQSSVATAPAHLVVPRNLHSQFGLAIVDGCAGVDQQLVPVAPHAHFPSVPLGHASQMVPLAPHGQVTEVPLVPLGQTSVLASQTATYALADQGSIGSRSELSGMISETSVSERQASMDSGRSQIALPRLDQRMLEDMSEQHMPTIHENARVDPLTLDDPWSRVRTSNRAACMSMDNDLSRSRCPFPMLTNTQEFHTPRDDALTPQACTTQPAHQNVSQPTGFPPTFSNQLSQQTANMDAETGIFMESVPQMWYPHIIMLIYRKDNNFYIALVMLRRKDVGFHMPHTTHSTVNSLGNPTGPKVAQGKPDPFDFQNQGVGQGGGNYVHLAANKTLNQHGHPQPRDASSIEHPELLTTPTFWRLE